jgi:prolipoprotein diacylglyceryltransferase
MGQLLSIPVILAGAGLVTYASLRPPRVAAPA